MAQKKWEGLTERGESIEVLRSLIDGDSSELSVRRQCELLGLSRSSFYYEAATETEANLRLMRLIDEQYMETPFFGSRRMTEWLKKAGHVVNRKRTQRLMRLMDLEAIYPKPRLSLGNKEHRKFQYLLRGLAVNRVHLNLFSGLDDEVHRTRSTSIYGNCDGQMRFANSQHADQNLWS